VNDVENLVLLLRPRIRPAMSLRFDERKATEAAAKFLELRGGKMHYLKLIKLLYLADREALLRWGYAITADRYVSMDHGPVTSQIYNLVVEEGDKPFWAEFISAPSDYQVSLLKRAPADLLSRAEEELLAEVFEKFGHMYRWDIVDLVHKLPEWKNPHGSSIPIEICEILEGGGLNREEIEEILREMHAEGAAQKVLQETA
jgi:uncharacterized phage-associated protein